MEELSLNIAFLPTSEILEKEVDAVFWMVTNGSDPVLRTAELLVPIIGYMASQADFVFPSTSRLERRQEAVAEVVQHARGLGLVAFLEMHRDQFSMPERGAPPYAAAALRRKEFARGSKVRARRVEEEAVLEGVIQRFSKLLSWLPVSSRIEIQNRLSTLPKDRYKGVAGHLLKFMPAHSHYIELMTAVGLNTGRKDLVNHFLDLELITAPLVYSDTFVTRDGGIRQILTELRGKAADAKQRYWQYEELGECLERLS